MTMICMRRATVWHGEVKGHKAATFPLCVTSDLGGEDVMGKLLMSTPTGEPTVMRGPGLCQQDAG